MTDVLEPHPLPGDIVKPIDEEPVHRSGAEDGPPEFGRPRRFDPAEEVKGRSPVGVALRQFRSQKPAVAGLLILFVLYVVTLFPGFIAPYGYDNQARDAQWAPPTDLHLSDASGFSWRPFIYPVRTYIDENFNIAKQRDTTRRSYLRLFVRGDPYSFMGLVDSNLHLFGFDPLPKSATGEEFFARYYLLGSDQAGRDIFSRICYGARISMTIGLIGASVVFVIGMLVGGISGYFGGWVDDGLQRLCEMIMLLPGFYLLLMLRYLFPSDLSSTTVYFAIILILSLIGWAGFARVIRGMVLSIRSEDYVMAARATGMRPVPIIVRHVLPNTMGYAIVALTLSIPGYILGESALSLLGLGIMEPVPSWGNMLSKAMNITELNQHAWVLWPGVFIFLAVMGFNLVGDGLRDAFDPKMRKRE